MKSTQSNLDDPTVTPVPQPAQQHQSVRLDLRLVVVVLLIVIVGMLLAWRPWSDAGAADGSRTVSVTGEASLKAEPDEFVFSPVYTIKNADRSAALAEISQKSQELTTKLKELGVKDNQIKTNADSYDRGGTSYPMPVDPAVVPDPSYSLQLTITVTSRDQAQKVQDYLTSTTPTGTVTPYANFSTTKRKELESRARDEATKDARAKADQSAKNLGFKVGKVKTVNDGSGFGVMPVNEMAFDSTTSSAPTQPRLAVQPGENELNYSVTVEYFVR